MTKRQVQRAVERHVAPRFPQLTPVGDLLIARAGALLRGFAFERSQMDKTAFRLRVFAQLLSVPKESVVFGLSNELGNFRVNGEEAAAFEAAADAAEAGGREFLVRVESYEAVVANLGSLVSAATDPRLDREVRAHGLAHLGRVDDAIRELEAVADELSPPGVPYEEAALARVRKLREALTRSRADGASLLERWTQETVEALGLQELPAAPG
jgi:hypothetical protein